MTGKLDTTGNKKIVTLFRITAALSVCAGAALWFSGNTLFLGITVVAFLISLAVLANYSSIFSGIAFSLWMAAAVTAPMFYPDLFKVWGGFEMRQIVIPLIMSIMFGMGTTLSVGDFKRVFLMPQAVLIGLVLQYTIMPFVGKGVAMTIAAGQPEVAAGVVLVGCSPGGVASNVITYLASGNVALSVTMTAISTLVSPFTTPALTKWLAGAYIQVKFWTMFISIIKMVIIPVGLGLLVNKGLRRMGEADRRLQAVSDGIFRFLPLYAMFAIAFSVSIMTANAREQLLIGKIVITILVSVMVHNALGLTLGYWGARLFRLGEKSCRTISIEVGLQNSGMAAGLALSVFKSPLAAVPGVVYSSWHNITGAVLASWWSKRPADDEARVPASVKAGKLKPQVNGENE
ncbi:MAG: bile acid:sodium symporter family protein [Candidatus Latescibacterota bacterium]